MVCDIAPDILSQINEYAFFHDLSLTDEQKEKIMEQAFDHLRRVFHDTGIVHHYMEEFHCDVEK